MFLVVYLVYRILFYRIVLQLAQYYGGVGGIASFLIGLF